MTHGAAERETELSLRFEPRRIECVAGLLEIVQDLEEIVPYEMFEHVAGVQRRTPTHGRTVEWLSPEPRDSRAQPPLLGKTHARMRRPFERAEIAEPEPASPPARVTYLSHS